MLKPRISNVGPFSSVLRHVYFSIPSNNDYSLALFMDNFLYKVDRIVAYENVLKAKYVRKYLFSVKKFTTLHIFLFTRSNCTTKPIRLQFKNTQRYTTSFKNWKMGVICEKRYLQGFSLRERYFTHCTMNTRLKHFLVQLLEPNRGNKFIPRPMYKFNMLLPKNVI